MTQWQPEYRPRPDQPPLSQWNETGLPPWTGPRYETPEYQPQFQPRQQYRAPYQPPGRSRLMAPLITGGAVLLVAVIAVVFVMHRGGSAKPLTCAQQYAAWKTGPGTAEAKAIEADSSALSAAGKDSDIKSMDTALEKIGTDAAADESHPMPACADPAGYWAQILADMKASGDNASVTPGLGGLLTAEAPLKPVTGLEAKLHAELERTTAAG